MPEHVLSSLQHRSIDVCAVSAATWQVRGPRTGDDSATVLLGYVQRVGDMFEATALLRPKESRATSTLAPTAASIAAGEVGK